MDLQEFKKEYYFFEANIFGKIYVYIDFGNVRPWAKEFWPEENKYRLCREIDIKKLAEVCNWVKPKNKLFFYGHYSLIKDKNLEHNDNKKYRSSIFRIGKAEASGFKVKTKVIKMIPKYDEEGKFIGKYPKCNFDVEITMSMLMKIRKYDTVMLFSGDSDFGSLLSYLKSKGKKIIVVCTRDRMSKELEEVADKFIPAETLAHFLMYKNKTLRQ